MSILAERMKNERESCSLTRCKVAEDLGITRASLEYYEKGERIPNADILLRIADYYKVSAYYLLGRTSIRNVYKDNEKLINDLAEIDDIIANDMSRLMEAARNVIATAKSIDSDLQKYYWRKSEEENDEAE